MSVIDISKISILTYEERENERKKYSWYKKNNKENITKRLGEIFYHMDLCIENYESFNLKLMHEKEEIYSLFGSDSEFMFKAKQHSNYLWDKNNKYDVKRAE